MRASLQRVRTRVRIAIGRREPVHDPRQPAVVAQDDVGIRFQGQKRRQRRDAVAHVPAHQQAAVARHVVAERQLAEIAAIERDQQPAREAAEDDPAGALVGRQAVGLPLRIVEFLLPRLDVDVGVRHLAEIDFRARHRQPGRAALHRHVPQDQRRQPFGREAVDRVHRDAVAVRVDQLFVDPVAAALRQLVDVQLARREHHLPERAVDAVPIDVDVREIVVGADFLELPERVLQGAPVPEPDVLERRLVVRGVGRLDGRLGREGTLRNPVQPVGLPRHLDVVRDVGPLLHELVRLDDEGVRHRRRRRRSRGRRRRRAAPRRPASGRAGRRTR